MIHSKIRFFSPFHLNMNLNVVMVIVTAFFLYLGFTNFNLIPALLLIFLMYKIFDWYRTFTEIKKNVTHEQWTEFKDSKFFKIITKTKWILYLVVSIFCIVQFIQVFTDVNLVDRIVSFVSLPIMIYYTSIFYRMSIDIK